MDNDVVFKPIAGTSQELALDTRCHHTLYHGTRGPGKCVHMYTKVLTTIGWKLAKDINFDDKLIAIDGTPTKILGIYKNRNLEFFELTFNDRSKVNVCKDHLWKVGNSKRVHKEGLKVRTTKFLYRSFCDSNKKAKWGIPYISFPAYGKKWTDFDPYVIGLILGDGTFGSSKITLYSIDKEIIDYCVNNHGWYKYKYKNSKCFRAVAPAGSSGEIYFRRIFWNKPVADEKAVPDELMVADAASRLAVLQGLMDADGSIEKIGNKCRFVSKSKHLCENVVELVRSLGGHATYYLEKRLSPKGGVNWRWRVNFNTRNLFNPFRLSRKRNRVVPTKRVKNLRYINNIKPIGNQDGVCFSIDHSSKLFIIENHLVTHNTITQLMRYRRFVGLGYGSFWRGIIFDREFKNLADVVAQSKKVFPKFEDGARWYSSAGEYKWEWPTGEILFFRHVKKLEDYDSFHGHEYPFIGWNELTKYPTADLYLKMMSINRSSFAPKEHTPTERLNNKKVYATKDRKPLKSIPLEVFSTTNPSGPGHSWIKRMFIDAADNGEIVRKHFTVFNPQSQQEETITRTQVAIFGSYRENSYLDPHYVAGLEEMTENNPNLKAAWLRGDWTVNTGGAIDDLWRTKVHVLPRFRIPYSWFVNRSFDWGSTTPFSVGWWAESNGEETKDIDGNVVCFPAGTLIQIAEWYGSEGIGTNKGLKLSAGDIAKGILHRERILRSEGWLKGEINGGPADNQIEQVRERDVDTILLKMQDEGVNWTKSDKSPGSRINGLQLFRDRLLASLRKEGPGIYFTNNCEASIETLPALPRDPDKPDDVDTDAEDHAWDMVRYRVLTSSNRLATDINIRFANAGV